MNFVTEQKNQIYAVKFKIGNKRDDGLNSGGVVLLTGVLEDLMSARRLVKSSSLVALFKLA